MSRLNKPKKNFTTVANNILEDCNVSWKAKGIYAYLVSKPDDYDFSVERIAQDTKDGEKATYNAVNEIIESGYMFREKIGNGRVVYHLFNNPSEKAVFIQENDLDPLCPFGKQPKPLSAETGGLNKTDTSSNKKINSEEPSESFPQVIQNIPEEFEPSEMAKQTIERICPDMTKQDFGTELVKFTAYFAKDWPRSPETKFINWCQNANLSYKQLKEKQVLVEKAGKLAEDRVQKFHEQKMENIANAKTTSNFKGVAKHDTLAKPELDLGRNNPIERFKGRFALKKAYVWTEDFSNKDDFKCYLADLEDLGIEIVGMDFEYEQTKKPLPIPKPTFGKVPSLEVDQRMAEARMARNREILKQQLQNA